MAVVVVGVFEVCVIDCIFRCFRFLLRIAGGGGGGQGRVGEGGVKVLYLAVVVGLLFTVVGGVGMDGGDGVEMGGVV